MLRLLDKHADDLPMLFIVSEVELKPAAPDDGIADEARPGVRIERAGGVKCDRCWRYVRSVSRDPAWAGLCERCQAALTAGGPREQGVADRDGEKASSRRAEASSPDGGSEVRLDKDGAHRA